VHRYTDYVHNDLIPAFGAVPLERLTHDHVNLFIQRELAAGRGLVTVRGCITTLSSALNNARRNHRLPVDVLQWQRRRQRRQQLAARHCENLDLVFARPDGQPLRPQYVLDHLRRLTAGAELPAIRVHDLRHVAATIMINEGVPLPVVSKTLRHKNVATTVDPYGHLARDAADDGVGATRSGGLDAADAQAA
jgi:integrase